MLGASDFAWQTARGMISRTKLSACTAPPVLGKGNLLLNSHLISDSLTSQRSAQGSPRCIFLNLLLDLVLC